MSREEYMSAVKEAIKKYFPKRNLEIWEEPGWQNIINGMYDRFSNYTPEQQQKLIKSAGPEEPFWDRVVMDGAFAFHMWA